MRTLMISLMASAMSIAAFQSAHAADAVDEIPAAPAAEYSQPAANWGGAYVGGTGSWQYGEFDKQGGNGANGLGVGAYGGYNMQSGQLVYGGEADLNYSGIDSRRGELQAEQGVNGSLRARVGVDLNPVLVYGTGGVAASRAKLENNTSSDTRTMYGWTAGVGAEGFVTDNITARVEYRYTDYSSKSFDLDGGKVRAGEADQAVRVGVGYKF